MECKGPGLDAAPVCRLPDVITSAFEVCAYTELGTQTAVVGLKTGQITGGVVFKVSGRSSRGLLDSVAAGDDPVWGSRITSTPPATLTDGRLLLLLAQLLLLLLPVLTPQPLGGDAIVRKAVVALRSS
jgi:hypothetical protein